MRKSIIRPDRRAKARRFRRAARRWGRGQTAVEFAMAALPLLLFMFAVMEASLLMYDYYMVSYAAANGARWAMVHGSTSGATASSSDVQSYVLTLVNGMDSANLTVTPTWSSAKEIPGSTVTVAVSYNHSFPPPFSKLGAITLSSSAASVITY